ncbi:MAG: non-canonical purine NTP diphosphatase [Flavisolibacter sp.]
MELLFATHNLHKVEEIRLSFPGISLKGLKEAGIETLMAEPFDTLEENAYSKASTIFNIAKCPTFSEDTGLEVFSLNLAPGVHSARYAGEERSFTKNTDKLLKALTPHQSRAAQFRTVICLILEGKAFYFEGICPGTISLQPQGTGGFGYDSIFIPKGYDKTFAQLTPQQKAGFSHRKLAADKLVIFLNNIR